MIPELVRVKHHHHHRSISWRLSKNGSNAFVFTGGNRLLTQILVYLNCISQFFIHFKSKVVKDISYNSKQTVNVCFLPMTDLYLNK